jgi:hypothetical protein
VIVYLWDAGHWCGISGELEDAQAAAVKRMNDIAWVEEARPVYGLRDLVRTYERTGRVWTAQPDRSWILSERSVLAGATAHEVRPAIPLLRISLRLAARGDVYPVAADRSLLLRGPSSSAGGAPCRVPCAR